MGHRLARPKIGKTHGTERGAEASFSLTFCKSEVQMRLYKSKGSNRQWLNQKSGMAYCPDPQSQSPQLSSQLR
jgi:hypothetical protein